MKENDDISLLNKRLDSIEDLLKVLVVNSFTDCLINTVSSETNENLVDLPDDLISILESAGFICTDSDKKNNIKIIYLESEYDYKLIDFVNLDYEIKSDFSIIPVFKFKKINGNRRKRFMEEEISFVTEKEIHIYTQI